MLVINLNGNRYILICRMFFLILEILIIVLVVIFSVMVFWIKCYGDIFVIWL